jgi:hypothetical protein
MATVSKESALLEILSQHGFNRASIEITANTARIKLPESDIDRLIVSKSRMEIIAEMKTWDLHYITIDLAPLQDNDIT